MKSYLTMRYAPQWCIVLRCNMADRYRGCLNNTHNGSKGLHHNGAWVLRCNMAHYCIGIQYAGARASGWGGIDARFFHIVKLLIGSDISPFLAVFLWVDTPAPSALRSRFCTTLVQFVLGFTLLGKAIGSGTGTSPKTVYSYYMASN